MRAWTLLLLLFAVAGCKDDVVQPPPPVRTGVLHVRLSTPNMDDGGVLFTVSGGAIDSVQERAFPLYSLRLSQDRWRLLVVGELATGIVADIWVPDVTRVDAYSATVEQVAARATYAQRTLDGYSVRVTAP